MLLLIVSGWVLLAVLVLPLVAVLGRAGYQQDGAAAAAGARAAADVQPAPVRLAG